MRNILLLAAALMILSYFLTWLVRIIALHRNIIDIPNERSSHLTPTPRGGGIAIVIAWYTGITILFLTGNLDRDLFLALMSGIALAAISLADDIISLKPVIRLLAQLVTALVAYYFLGGINSVVLFSNIIIPDVVAYPLAIIGITWFINLYNFLDGIDGYASIEAIMMGIFFFLLTGSLPGAVLTASVAGFLIWNWPKAKIFMGDVGSTQLGFILIILGIWFHNEQKLSILWWLVLTIPFWFDATLTLLRRLKNREKISEAHKKHIYQRLHQSGFSHLKVDILLVILNLLLFAGVWALNPYTFLQLPLLLITSIIMYGIARYTDRRLPFPKD